jgi:hypothetical protein
LRGFGFPLFELVVLAAGFEFELVFTESFAVGGLFDPEPLLEAISVNPPAKVTTHMLPNSGCAPHEIPATR